MRKIIESAEAVQALGVVEIAKATLLHGMRMMADITREYMDEEDKLTLVCALRDRSHHILVYCQDNKRLMVCDVTRYDFRKDLEL